MKENSEYRELKEEKVVEIMNSSEYQSYRENSVSSKDAANNSYDSAYNYAIKYSPTDAEVLDKYSKKATSSLISALGFGLMTAGSLVAECAAIPGITLDKKFLKTLDNRISNAKATIIEYQKGISRENLRIANKARKQGEEYIIE